MFVQCKSAYLLVIIARLAYSWTDYLNFDNCYPYQIHEVNTDKSYQVTWDGDHISWVNCQIGFHAYDPYHVLTQYQVCIRATKWYIQNTNMQLKYYSGLEDFLKQTYSYFSLDKPTTEWCSDSDDYVDIELVTGSATNVNQSSFTLEVRGVTTYDYNKFMGWIIGATVGAVLFISLIIIVVIIVACRRRRSPGMTYGVVPQTGNVVTQNCSQQIIGGYPNYGYGTIASPPPYNAKNVCSPLGYQAQPAEYQQQTNQTASPQTTGASQQTRSTAQETPEQPTS